MVKWNIQSVRNSSNGEEIEVLVIDGKLIDWHEPENGQYTLLDHLIKLHPELEDEIYA